MSEVQLVFLNSLRLFEAQLVAARLGAEGIVWAIKGADPLYPMGSAEIWVDTHDFDLAIELVTCDASLELADVDDREDGSSELS